MTDIREPFGAGRLSMKYIVYHTRVRNASAAIADRAAELGRDKPTTRTAGWGWGGRRAHDGRKWAGNRARKMAWRRSGRASM